MEDRRKFERISVPTAARLFAETPDGKRLGPIRELGKGGLLVETSDDLALGETYQIVIVDGRQQVRREVSATVRYLKDTTVGLQFHNLELDAAVEIGVLVAKFYSGAPID